MPAKPKQLKEEHLLYLDDLRESGVTNMFGAARYLENAFPLLSLASAGKILAYWMKIFSERHLRESQ
jgi:hypothetical protein